MYYAPISQEMERRLTRPLEPNRLFDLDTVVPRPVAWQDELWVEHVNATKYKFEVDDTSALFSTWKVQEAELFGANDFNLIVKKGSRLVHRREDGPNQRRSRTGAENGYNNQGVDRNQPCRLSKRSPCDSMLCTGYPIREPAAMKQQGLIFVEPHQCQMETNAIPR